MRYAQNIFVIVVALSFLTSCAKPMAPQILFNSGYSYCDSPSGAQFGVVLSRSTQYSGDYTLQITATYIPATVAPGQYLRAGIADKANDERDIAREVSETQNAVVATTTLSPLDVQTFTIVIIAPDDLTNTPLLQLQTSSAAICTLPTTDPNNQATVN